LLDEPEAHLHPPLLSAFIRALSDLLVNRNGVAIIATHSPVVLQEVPKICVWKIWRNGREVVVERPEIETFAENVGILTRKVFGLEVANSGFHKLLSESESCSLRRQCQTISIRPALAC
jgi:predicted ATP-dependent endonuclease of OLD family